MNASHRVLAALAVAALTGLSAQAQDRIFRCGNEFTNNEADAKARGCRPVQGGNLTIVQSQRPAPTASAPARVATAPSTNNRVDTSAQRARDADARVIFEAELRKAEARRAELMAEYNNGEPERRGDEARNYQKYLDRVEELKASIARNDNDIAGLKRELARLPAP